MLCISTSEHMLAHALAWSKMIKNALKLLKTDFFIMCTRGSCKAHVEIRFLTTFKLFHHFFIEKFWGMFKSTLKQIHHTPKSRHIFVHVTSNFMKFRTSLICRIVLLLMLFRIFFKITIKF